VVRALKYPPHADSAVFCGDDMIQAFILHGDFILIESQAECLTQGRLPRILPQYEEIRVMVSCDIPHTLDESEARVQAQSLKPPLGLSRS